MQMQSSTGQLPAKITRVMVEFLERTEEIRSQLENFDRELSDNIRPLAYIYDGFEAGGKGGFERKQPGENLSNNFVFQMVIDKIC